LSSTDTVSKEEFKELIQMLKKYVESEMDQWEMWKFHSSRGPIYINISMMPDASEDAYIDLNHFIDLAAK
jgi:hypothetical protein